MRRYGQELIAGTVAAFSKKCKIRREIDIPPGPSLESDLRDAIPDPTSEIDTTSQIYSWSLFSMI